MLVTIQSAADADLLVQPLQLPGQLRAAVRIPHVSRVQSSRWERDLNTSLSECGCTQGAVCTVVALGASIGWNIIHTDGFEWRSFLVRTAVAMLAAAAIGKFAALAWARIRIARIVRDIRARAAMGDLA